ncbi:hypothetical protein JCM1841_001659, partial [Sporobolomyces salmonicolor]
LYSFVSRMKDEARRRGVDLLLVDSGDRVDGNGLVDAEPSPYPKGYTALSLFAEMPYDVVTTGNHELYKYPVAKYTREVLQGKFGDRWVVSNVNITLEDEGGTAGREEVLLGNRYRKFETEMGRKVTAFGPLFDFKAHAPGISVQSPEEMVKENWFLNAVADRPDFFLLVGHMSIRIEPDSEWSAVVAAIRAFHPTTPVLVFGGHHHIRDCTQEDDYSMSLAAGRYMETIGWMSVSNLNSATRPPKFARRYLDQNRNTYSYHTGLSDFDVPQGKEITRTLAETAKRFNLTEKFGLAPQDYFLYHYPATSPHSIFQLLTAKVLPLMIRREDRPHKPFTVLNTGSVRFDVFKGAFTRNDHWIVLPFPNHFLYIPAIPVSVASKLLHYLNLVGEHGLLPSQQAFSPTSSSLFSPSALFPTPEQAASAQSAHLEHSYRRSLALSSSAAAPAFGRWRLEKPTEGYVTLDACGHSSPAESFGDDTLHRPFRAARQPIFVATALPPPRAAAAASSKVDVVFFDFIQPDILSALNVLDRETGRRYSAEDVERYVDGVSANTLLEQYARSEWN